MLDKALRGVAYYGLFIPITTLAIVTNRLSLVLFIFGAWLISPWFKVKRVNDNNGGVSGN